MVGIGLVGCGQWGQNYLRSFAELDTAQVVAACDESEARLAQVRRRAPYATQYSGLDQILQDDAVNAVVVATPTATHYNVASEVLQSGRHCLVEKPMTTTVAEAEALRDTANQAGRLLMVGHIFRHNAAVNYVRRLISDGEIGDVLYLYLTRTNLGPIRSDVNVVWDLMTHDVSIVYHLMNRTPEWVSAQGASFLDPAVEDAAFATLGFEGGEVANIRASWLDPRKVREITVVGSRRMVVVDDMDPAPVRIYDKGAAREPSYENFGEFKLVTRSGNVVIPAIAPSEPLRNQCQHFVDSINRGHVELGDAEDGIRVVRTLVGINASMAAQGAPVAFSPVADALPG
jgi:predicted dehydrogenase